VETRGQHQPPDYWPGWWRTSGMNARFVNRPDQVFWMLLAFAVVGIGIIAWAILDPHGYFNGTVRAYSGLVAAPLLVLLAAVYAPRARRAMNQRHS
jgi:hypothetical protein